MRLNNVSTCCEGQATRLLGSLPEYLVSFDTAASEVWVDIYADADVSLAAVVPARGGEGAQLRLRTEWPLGASVHATLQLPFPANFTLRMRLPSWLPTPSASVTVRAASGVTEAHTGARGSYLSLKRRWSDGDEVRLSLPMRLRATRYTGLTRIAGHERYAVEYGPVLLALTGGVWDDSVDSMMVRGVADPSRAETWLAPIPGEPLRFRVLPEASNPGMRFIPYYEVQEELFEVYPAMG